MASPHQIFKNFDWEMALDIDEYAPALMVAYRPKPMPCRSLGGF
jgi:hypothetical protein